MRAVLYQFINESADVDDRQAGHDVLADNHTVDKALGCMAEVGTHEASGGAESPALGGRVPVLQAKGHQCSYPCS